MTQKNPLKVQLGGTIKLGIETIKYLKTTTTLIKKSKTGAFI